MLVSTNCWRSRAYTGALVLAAWVGAGCDSILGTDQSAFANEARIRVDGTFVAPLQLLTSSNFIATRDETGELVAQEIVGQTLTLTQLPFDRVFDLRGTDRFLVRLANPDASVTVNVHFRIELDGREVYNQRANMTDASMQYIAYFRF